LRRWKVTVPDAGEVSASSLAGQSVRQAQAILARAFGAAGIEEPARDARLLLLAALGLSSVDIVRAPDRRLTDADARGIAASASRRLDREPVSRIAGVRGFYGREFRITPATLDPRPCTETVVEAALEVVDEEGWRTRPIRILDIGTGSGALVVSLLAELPLATGTGTDISDEALAVAQANAQRLGVADRATFLNRRSLDGVDGAFDLLVSNPPYIPGSDIAGLEPEVKNFDPRGALDGGPDGLDVYRALAAGLSRCVPDGWALFEVGAGQALSVTALLKEALGSQAGLRQWTDLGGHTRCVAVRTHRYPSP
jgi:release factor glutamine methyltransferase